MATSSKGAANVPSKKQTDARGFKYFNSPHTKPGEAFSISGKTTDEADDLGEFTVDNVRRTRDSRGRDGFLTVSNQNAAAGAWLCQYSKQILSGAEAKSDWSQYFHMDYFYFVLSGVHYLAEPTFASMYTDRVFDSASANAEFRVSSEASDVHVHATKNIHAGEPIKIYSGSTVNSRWVDGGWKHIIRRAAKNVYISRGFIFGRDPTSHGGCKDQVCLEECVCYRADHVCTTGLCSCTPKTCANRPFEQPFPKVEKKKSKIHGNGLYAVDTIPPGGWIVEYVGEVIDPIELQERSRFYKKASSNYVVEGQYVIIDATRLGNAAREANHSCDPNAKIVEVIDNDGYPRILLRALRDKPIKPGDEITYDYAEVVDFKSELLACRCSSRTCTKKLNRLKTPKEIATENTQQKETARAEYAATVNDRMETGEGLRPDGDYLDEAVDIYGRLADVSKGDVLKKLNILRTPRDSQLTKDIPRQGPKRTHDIAGSSKTSQTKSKAAVRSSNKSTVKTPGQNMSVESKTAVRKSNQKGTDKPPAQKSSTETKPSSVNPPSKKKKTQHSPDTPHKRRISLKPVPSTPIKPDSCFAPPMANTPPELVQPVSPNANTLTRLTQRRVRSATPKKDTERTRSRSPTAQPTTGSRSRAEKTPKDTQTLRSKHPPPQPTPTEGPETSVKGTRPSRSLSLMSALKRPKTPETPDTATDPSRSRSPKRRPKRPKPLSTSDKEDTPSRSTSPENPPRTHHPPETSNKDTNSSQHKRLTEHPIPKRPDNPETSDKGTRPSRPRRLNTTPVTPKTSDKDTDSSRSEHQRRLKPDQPAKLNKRLKTQTNDTKKARSRSPQTHPEGRPPTPEQAPMPLAPPVTAIQSVSPPSLTSDVTAPEVESGANTASLTALRETTLGAVLSEPPPPAPLLEMSAESPTSPAEPIETDTPPQPSASPRVTPLNERVVRTMHALETEAVPTDTLVAPRVAPPPPPSPPPAAPPSVVSPKEAVREKMANLEREQCTTDPGAYTAPPSTPGLVFPPSAAHSAAPTKEVVTRGMAALERENDDYVNDPDPNTAPETDSSPSLDPSAAHFAVPPKEVVRDKMANLESEEGDPDTGGCLYSETDSPPSPDPSAAERVREATVKRDSPADYPDSDNDVFAETCPPSQQEAFWDAQPESIDLTETEADAPPPFANNMYAPHTIEEDPPAPHFDRGISPNISSPTPISYTFADHPTDGGTASLQTVYDKHQAGVTDRPRKRCPTETLNTNKNESRLGMPPHKKQTPNQPNTAQHTRDASPGDMETEAPTGAPDAPLKRARGSHTDVCAPAHKRKPVTPAFPLTPTPPVLMRRKQDDASIASLVKEAVKTYSDNRTPSTTIAPPPATLISRDASAVPLAPPPIPHGDLKRPPEVRLNAKKNDHGGSQCKKHTPKRPKTPTPPPCINVRPMEVSPAPTPASRSYTLPKQTTMETQECDSLPRDAPASPGIPQKDTPRYWPSAPQLPTTTFTPSPRRDRSPSPPPSEPTSGTMSPTQQNTPTHDPSYHTTAIKGFVRHPQEPPSRFAQDLLLRAAMDSARRPGEPELDHYSRIAGVMGDLSEVYDKDAAAYQKVMAGQLDSMKVHLEGETHAADAAFTAAKFMAQTDQERATADRRFARESMEHEKVMKQLDLQMIGFANKQAVHAQQLEKLKLDTELQLLEMEQARNRMTNAKMHVFGFSPEEGTSLTLSTHPCDVYKRQEFDQIWNTQADALRQDQFDDLAKRLVSLNVVANPVAFKRYINQLTQRAARGVDDSILKKRADLLTKYLSKTSGVFVFQTGPVFEYAFVPWQPSDSAVGSPLTVAQMFGNPRYAVHLGRGNRLFAADLWEPALVRDRFPVNMPYPSPQAFKRHDGVDSYGTLYSDVYVTPSADDPEAFRAPVAGPPGGLEVTDIKTTWFKLPQGGRTDPVYGKYYAAEDAVKAALEGPNGAARFFQLLHSANRADPVLMYVMSATFLKHKFSDPGRAKDQDMTTIGEMVHDGSKGVGVTESYNTARMVYSNLFPNEPLTDSQHSEMEFIFISFPRFNDEQAALRAVTEVDVMASEFTRKGMSTDAFSAAHYLYRTPITGYTFNSLPPNDVAVVLTRLNDIDMPFDPVALPVLTGNMQNLLEHTFAYLGLQVESSSYGELSTDVLLRRRNDFDTRFPAAIGVLHEPLKRALITHGFHKYWEALKRQMGASDSTDCDDENENYYVETLTPVSYSIQRTVFSLQKDDEVIYDLQRALYDETVDTMARLNDMLDTGVPADPMEVLGAVQKREEIIRLESHKRDVVLEKLKTLRKLARVPTINRAIDQVLKHKEDIVAILVDLAHTMEVLAARRRDLMDNMLHCSRTAPGAAPIIRDRPPPTPPHIPQQSFVSDAQHTLYSPPQVQEDEDVVEGEEMEEEEVEYEEEEEEEEEEDVLNLTDETPVSETNAGWPNDTIDCEVVTTTPSADISYLPVSEKWRKEVLLDVFHVDPSMYPRSTFAFGFAPLKRAQKDQQLGVRNVKGDGNCFFRSLSMVLFGVETEHPRVRNVLHAYATQHQKTFKTWCSGVTPTIAVMNRDKEWADELVIAMTSVLLHTRVYTHSKTGDHGWIEPPMLHYDNEGDLWPEESIYLDHINQNHFAPVHGGINLPGDIYVTDAKGTFDWITVPTLTPNRTVYADAGLLRLLLTAALGSRGLRIHNYNNRTQQNRNINATYIYKKKGGVTAVKKRFLQNYLNATPRDNRRVTLTKHKNINKVVWTDLTTTRVNRAQITMVQADQGTNRIQDGGDGVLMVDFANKYIGGGVLARGMVQEELQFLSYPELIISKLLADGPMEDDEAIVVTGVKRFSDYTYAANGHVIPKADPAGSLGSFVAIDATNYTSGTNNQYSRKSIDRELHKALVGFDQPAFHTIQTGNWGGGAFGGDIRLKFIVQAMVCAHLGKDMVYSCFEETDMTTLIPVLNYCGGKTIGALYDTLASLSSRADLDTTLNRQY